MVATLFPSVLNELLGDDWISAAVNAADGDNEVIAATASKVIRVHALALKAAADATLLFEDSLNGTAISGIVPAYATPTVSDSGLANVGDGGWTLPPCGAGWMQTSAGNALNLAVSGGDVDGVIVYSKRDA